MSHANHTARDPAAPSLQRALGPTTALLITVGAMVGSGIFATPNDVAKLITSPALTLALWCAGGVLALLGALSIAELGAAIPDTGGMYVHLRRAYGPIAAFTFAWAMLVVLVPSSMGYFATVASHHIAALAGWSESREPAIAAAMVAMLVLANLLGVRSGAGVQNLATVVKYGGLLAVAMLGLFVRHPAHAVAATSAPRASAIVAAVVPILWAYDGWVDVTSMAGEVRNPERNVPRSLILGTLLVTAVYLIANIAYLRVLGTAGLASTQTPAADAARAVWGELGRRLVLVLVAVSTFGGCAVALLTGSRVVYAVARAGDFLGFLGHTSRAGVPDAAIASCGVVAIGYLSSQLGLLGQIFVIGAWPFYAATAVATVVLRRREPQLPRPHRTIGYPYTLLVFATVSMSIVVGYGFTEPLHTGISLGLIAAGVPVYWVTRALRG